MSIEELQKELEEKLEDVILMARLLDYTVGMGKTGVVYFYNNPSMAVRHIEFIVDIIDEDRRKYKIVKMNDKDEILSTIEELKEELIRSL